MKAAISISELAASIMALPGPVVMMDTCSVLDIIRAGHRADVSSLVVPAAAAFLLAANPPARRGWIVALPQVGTEWARHCAQEGSELRNKITEAEILIEKFHSAAGIVTPYLTITFSALRSQTVDASLVALSESVMNCAEVLSPEQELMMRALERSLRRDAPAHKGGSIEDCVIVEHYMELTSVLRASKFTDACVFVSSNSRDFGPAGSPLPPLDAQFSSMGLEYVKDLSRARTRINQLAGSQII